MGEYVVIEREEWLASVILNRPERLNALNFAMWDDLAGAMAASSGVFEGTATFVVGSEGEVCAGPSTAVEFGLIAFS